MLLCCNKQKNDENKIQPKYPIFLSDTSSIAKGNKCLILSEIGDYKVKGDTLWILSSDKFLYYPFGIHQDIRQMESVFPLMSKTQIEEDNTVLENFYYKRSSIVTVFDGYPNVEDSERGTSNMEIVYAKIADSEVALVNGLRVGLNKLEFAHYLPIQLLDNEWNNIDIVFFESELLGMWHYYYFSNTLDSIVFKTDYQFDLRNIK
jgi:hypothetical protein